MNEMEGIAIMPTGQVTLEGKKDNKGKTRLGLVPRSLIWAVGYILTKGAKKYGSHNWRKGLAWSDVYDALQRHLTDWWDGKSIDQDLKNCIHCQEKAKDMNLECPDHSWKSHLWHATCEIAFLIEYEISGTGLDDRYKNEIKS